ncbi:MAG: OmpA family protein [candidate division Zixibacteria bacterium]|nr:OmpA family protein [candidate division Zixibacteria bacterium]
MMKNRGLSFWLICAGMALLLCDIALAGVSEKLTYQGNKARIAVGTIKNKSADCDDEMAASIGEMLSTALANNEKFIVLASKEEVEELAEEIDLGESEYVEEGRGPEKGLMEGADVLVTGAVTGFEPEASGGGGGLGALKNKAFGKVGLQSKSAKILIDIKLIDIRTRRVIKAMSLEGKSTSWGADVAGGGWVEDVALVGGLGSYSNQPMEKAIRDVLAKAANKIGKDVPEEYYRYTGQGQYTQQYGESGAKQAAGETGGKAAAGGEGTGAVRAENMKLFTKYDFIPGDKVIFYDDFSGEEVGEFPSKWSLDEGVFEIAAKGERKWVMCTDQGSIRPKIKTTLPSRFTVELDIYSNGADQSGHYYHIYVLDANEKKIAEFNVTSGKNSSVSIYGKEISAKELTSKLGKGVHTMRIMATPSTMKCYVDNERVANIPEIENFQPAMLRIYCDPWKEQGNPMLMGTLRVAEGGKSMRQQLDETGKIVTHGILFDSGSDVIKGESYKTLAEIGQLLTDDPNLRLSIEGHTDSDGEEAYNLDLSQRRAASVKAYLASSYQIDGSRLETKGFGESKPIDANTTAEG